jgi:hypothetical protein
MNSNASIICQSHHNQIYKVQHQKGSRSLASKCPQRIRGLSAPERDVTLNNKKSFYSKDDDISSDESDEEDNGGEVLFITQENQDDDHKNSKEEEIIFEEDSDEETNLDSFWGYKENAKSEQEDENLEKLKHVET